MFIYLYPFGDKIGEYVVIGSYENNGITKELIYSLSTDYFPKFFLIFNGITNNKFKIKELTDEKETLLRDEMVIEYFVLDTIMNQDIKNIKDKKEIYFTQIRQNDIGVKSIYEACKHYYKQYENKEDKIVQKIISKLL